MSRTSEWKDWCGQVGTVRKPCDVRIPDPSVSPRPGAARHVARESWRNLTAVILRRATGKAVSQPARSVAVPRGGRPSPARHATPGNAADESFFARGRPAKPREQGPLRCCFNHSSGLWARSGDAVKSDRENAPFQGICPAPGMPGPPAGSGADHAHPGGRSAAGRARAPSRSATSGQRSATSASSKKSSGLAKSSGRPS